MATHNANINLEPNVIVDATTATFKAEVIDDSERVLVLADFWAPWCGPSQMLMPLLKETVSTAKGTIKLVKINIDEHPELSDQLNISSIPTVIAFVDGQPVDGFVGVISGEALVSFVQKIKRPSKA